MIDDESTILLCTLITNIINSLVAFNKVYSNLEITRKILNSLSKHWNEK